MPQTAAHAMKSLRLPVAGGRQAIFGTHGCRISPVTRHSQGTCRSQARSPGGSAQPLPWPHGTFPAAAPRGQLVLPRLLPHQRCHNLSCHHVWQSAPTTTRNGLTDGTGWTSSVRRWEVPGKLASRRARSIGWIQMWPGEEWGRQS